MGDIWWRSPLVWVLATLVLILIAILSADLIRFQMIRGLFWRPKKLIPGKQTIVIIDPMMNPASTNFLVNPAYCLADYIMRLADVNIDVIHYPEANKKRVMQHGPACVLISGLVAPWANYDLSLLEPVFDFLKNSSLPILGICGGHQVIARAFGVPVAPMGSHELGYTAVELLDNDPILKGLSSPITVFNWHHEEAKEMPADFDLLGSSKQCPIQIFRHREKKIYGVQFHPELSGRKKDSRKLLINFLTRAGISMKRPG